MKYPMTEKTDRPMFEYMVTRSGEEDYYLYDRMSFNDALNKAVELSRNDEIGLLYEIVLNNETREYRARNTFTVYDGEVHYDKYHEIGLHLHFYINAGYWLNPNEEWLKILNK